MRELPYFQLRAFLYPRERERTVEFKLEELESIWFCTRKNVKRRLKKICEEGKCIYFPGKGRGHPSRLRFERPLQEEVEEAVRIWIQHDMLENIVQLMQLPIPRTWIIEVSNELQSLFGIQGSGQEKDILRTMISRNIITIDPLYSSTTFENHLIRQLGDTLVIYDEKNDEIRPHLAHHWKVNEDGSEWIIYLRKGINFHHHRTLTSEDVLYTVRRFQLQSSPLSWMVEDIEKVDCPGPFTVKFHLKRSNPFFLRYLSAVNLTILPYDVPFDERRWIGTGPFQLQEWTDHKLVLKAFDLYFLERPFLDEVQFWRVPKGTSRMIRYQVEKERDLQETKHQKQVETGFRFLAFNFRKPSIVHNDDFREAIYHLLDMKKMWKDLGRDDLIESSHFFPWKSDPLPKQPDRVKQLLQQAGYRGEELTFYALNFPNAIQETEWLIQEGKQAGINIRPVYYELGELYSDRLDREADLLTMGEVSSVDLHLSFLSAFYNRVLFFHRFLSPQHFAEIERRLEQFKHEPDQTKRNDIIDEVVKYLHDRHLIVFKHHPMEERVFDPMIQDIRFESFGYVDFRKLWLEQ